MTLVMAHTSYHLSRTPFTQVVLVFVVVPVKIVCRVDLTTIGTAADTYASNYLGLLLGAGFKTKIPSVLTDSVTAVDANSYTPTSAPAIADIGTLISSYSLTAALSTLLSLTTTPSSGDVSISPALSASSIHSCKRSSNLVHSKPNGYTGSYDNSVAFRIDGVNFSTEAFGCVMESLNI